LLIQKVFYWIFIQNKAYRVSKTKHNVFLIKKNIKGVAFGRTTHQQTPSQSIYSKNQTQQRALAAAVARQKSMESLNASMVNRKIFTVNPHSMCHGILAVLNIVGSH
jgi:hypothetical protein